MAHLAYSIDQVVELTSVGRTTIYNAIRDGSLTCRKVGKRTLVLSDELQRWLESAAVIAPRASKREVA